MSDIRAAKENIPILPASIYTFAKGYYDLNWFHTISSAGRFFQSENIQCQTRNLEKRDQAPP